LVVESVQKQECILYKFVICSRANILSTFQPKLIPDIISNLDSCDNYRRRNDISSYKLYQFRCEEYCPLLCDLLNKEHKVIVLHALKMVYSMIRSTSAKNLATLVRTACCNQNNKHLKYKYWDTSDNVNPTLFD